MIPRAELTEVTEADIQSRSTTARARAARSMRRPHSARKIRRENEDG